MSKYNKISLLCYSLLIALVIMQWIFWYGISIGDKQNDDELIIWEGTRATKPDLAVVPDLPTDHAVKIFSLGDEQFYFRLKAFDIQNAGDTFGRTTALKDYDYEKLYKWWKILDDLDSRSNFVPPLVSYYYGSSQRPERDLPYVIQYLEEHADLDPGKKWWWYSQAIYHAKHKLNDLDSALRIAEKLSHIPEDAGAPLWARQMPAFILEAKGDYNAACDIIINIVDNYKDVKEGELNFMMYFIRERVAAMIEAQKDPNAKPLAPRCQAILEAEKAKQKAKEQSENIPTTEPS